jgi:light-regulated signal transduction histidine kinase (bacteriophytochrome)
MVGYEKGSIYNGMFPAAPLEQAILDVIAEQLQNLPQLREQIVRTVKEQAALLGADVSKLEDLRKRREQIRKRTEWMFSTFDEATLADAKTELDRLGVERKSLDEQIAAAQTVAQTAAIDPQQVADAVVEQLKNLPSDWKSMPVFALRETIGTFVEKVIGDMGTNPDYSA